ncbi:MAG TPA: SRPBCC family protein [Trueperaceae bacterium]|nr:SRPBCC family protein [Trueperaceae bacterium]
MSTTATTEHKLILERVFDAEPERVFRAWTEPEILKKWFAPKPFTTPKAELDVRPGGTSLIVMRDAEGNDYPNVGVYLHIEPGRRLVSTDAYREAWVPSERPFMTMDLRFDPLPGGKTKATYVVSHWTQEAYDQHVQMGFHEGWGTCANQLAELLATD